MKQKREVEVTVCDVCGKDTVEGVTCRQCGKDLCSDCQRLFLLAKFHYQARCPKCAPVLEVALMALGFDKCQTPTGHP